MNIPPVQQVPQVPPQGGDPTAAAMLSAISQVISNAVSPLLQLVPVIKNERAMPSAIQQLSISDLASLSYFFNHNLGLPAPSGSGSDESTLENARRGFSRLCGVNWDKVNGPGTVSKTRDVMRVDQPERGMSDQRESTGPPKPTREVQVQDTEVPSSKRSGDRPPPGDDAHVEKRAKVDSGTERQAKATAVATIEQPTERSEKQRGSVETKREGNTQQAEEGSGKAA
ncbi:hypothetical protein HDU93_005142 [Gonapodya sp. JEL0774]|nr:hypothetical protein HDU93_005142 [Gonapodya sp. JEL0774]